MSKIKLNILQTCTSTNDIAIKYAKQGMSEGNSYLSYLQTKGRGRNNNEWESLEGNLFLSTILRPKTDKTHWHQLSLIIGFSMLETLVSLGVDRNEIELKWPNDVLVNKKKISGILLESFDNFIVAGIGLNIVKTPYNEKKWNTTKLNNHSEKDHSLKYITKKLLKKIFKNYLFWENKGFIFFNKKINDNFKNINENIIFKLKHDSKDLRGTFLGLGDNGSLKIKVGKENFEFYSVESFFFPDEELL